MSFIKSNPFLEKFFDDNHIDFDVLTVLGFRALQEKINYLEFQDSQILYYEQYDFLSVFDAYILNVRQEGRKGKEVCFAYIANQLTLEHLIALPIECFILSVNFDFCFHVVDGNKYMQMIYHD